MKLSEHFTLEEMVASGSAARLGIDNTPAPEIVDALRVTAELLEKVRELLGHPIVITSGYRSPELNKAIGGAANSAHTRGQAADFICPGFGKPLKVCRAIVRSPLTYDQIILEFPPNGWTHIATGPRKQVLTIDSKGTRYGIDP